jgi:biopolymer transport protein ExbD
MGYEYKICASVIDQDQALRFIRQHLVITETATSVLEVALPAANKTDSNSRSSTNWPPVFLSIESDGFYFCDNGTAANETAIIFKLLIDFLMSANQEIRIVEL